MKFQTKQTLATEWLEKTLAEGPMSIEQVKARYVADQRSNDFSFRFGTKDSLDLVSCPSGS